MMLMYSCSAPSTCRIWSSPSLVDNVRGCCRSLYRTKGFLRVPSWSPGNAGRCCV